VLDRLEEVRLLDDAAYAEAFVRSRQRTGQSRAVVRRDLRSKGVSEEEADAALAEIDVDREREAALLLASRRAARTAGLTEQVRRRRLYGLLARRGYPADLVVSVVAEVLGAADAVAEVGEGSVTEPTEADEIPLSESLS
jgi:regulatory protein